MRNDPHRKRKLWLAAATCVLTLLMSLPASAGLGASSDSISDDQLSLKASLKVISARDYTVYELLSPLGLVVREYVSSTGNVFAVSWHGIFAPDMHRLLSERFDLYLVESRRPEVRTFGHSAVSIRKPFLVVESIGHMRAYTGRAYDPSLLPTGISIDDIR